MKVKVTAQILANAINSQRTADIKAGKGKATYAVTTKQMEPFAKVLNGKVSMPAELFTSRSANDRRVWCEQHKAEEIKASDYCTKVNPQRPDNAFRIRFERWQEICPVLGDLSFQRVAVTSKATEGDDRIYLYRVA